MNVSTNTCGIDKLSGIDKLNSVLIRKDLKKIKDTGKENKTGIFDTEDKVDISFKTFDLNALQHRSCNSRCETGKGGGY